ncbi:hypothetical protein DPEC_G00149140 [Dallia pectoralis]|uniref:Uncharacterized protein n=1 Tax=Dallia pectoralis TaxID=75939 RepID=A0ACC2GJ42_DALPE|nr:hypothetical protein DPEC_G00149140 [Dallia pectoralis]
MCGPETSGGSVLIRKKHRRAAELSVQPTATPNRRGRPDVSGMWEQMPHTSCRQGAWPNLDSGDEKWTVKVLTLLSPPSSNRLPSAPNPTPFALYQRRCAVSGQAAGPIGGANLISPLPLRGLPPPTSR